MAPIDRFLGVKESEPLERQWRRRLIALVAMFYAVISIVVCLVTSIPHGFTRASLISLIAVMFYGIAVHLARYTAYRLPALIILLTSFFSIIAFATLSGGFGGPGGLLFIGIPFTGALLLGIPGAVGFGLLSLLALCAVQLPIILSNSTMAVVIDTILFAANLVALTAFSVMLAMITDRMLSESEKALTQAIVADSAKANFLATVSHEARTPLNAIIGFSATLLQKETDSNTREQLGTIHNAGEFLLGMLNDVLDVSRIEQGKLELKEGLVNLQLTARRLRTFYAQQAEDKNLAFHVELNKDLRLLRVGDQHRIGQILNNLVSNALKFTHNGSIRVEIEEPDQGWVHMRVIDTGIGMTPEETENVFESFMQADTSITRNYGGNGLGLSIIRGLAQKMGGNVKVSSTLGKGTTFTVMLPLPVAEAGRFVSPEDKPETDWDNKKFAGERWLIVDDNPVNRLVLKTLLTPTDVTPILAESGEEAIDIARSQTLDVIFMDIAMPSMDGIEAMRRIRAILPPDVMPVILAVTAHTFLHQVTEFLHAGFDGHVAKPIVRETLFAEIIRCKKEVEHFQQTDLTQPLSAAARAT